MSEVLKEITYLTLKKLKNNEIVLPGEYSKEFENHACTLEFDLDDEKTILDHLSTETDRVNHVVAQTNKNLNELKDSTTNAKKAIEEKDTKSLDLITGDLVKMQERINQLQKELFSDALTKAYNRKWFMENFLENDTFTEDGFLVFIDVDKFKTINDTRGHVVGDQVLKFLVKFLKNDFESNDGKVIRYAGDEFMVLFTKTDKSLDDIEKMFVDSQLRLSKLKLKSDKIDALQFAFSYGVGEFKTNDKFEKVIELIDEKMYENKKR